jgi:predicted dehydrogenase
MIDSAHTQPPGASSVALVGCGAIADLFYLPALALHPEVTASMVIVDADRKRAEAAAAKYHCGSVATDYTRVIGSVRGAIIAVPHRLHHRMSGDFLDAGVHVLCEKPIAETGDEVRDLIARAAKGGVTIGVNNTRRLAPSAIRVKELLDAGAIGTIRSLEFLDGSEFDWPTASGFYFNSGVSSKGVLLDMGAHVVDLICWWLKGKPVVTSSENDSFGGTEAVASVKFTLGACSGEVRLSRLSKLPNTYRITGDRGMIEGGAYEVGRISLTGPSGKKSDISCFPPPGRPADSARAVVDNFLEVLHGKSTPLIPASGVVDSIEVIGDAYARATRFSMPWYAREEVNA